MSFVEYADSFVAKLHLNCYRKPLLIGAVVLVALVCAVLVVFSLHNYQEGQTSGDGSPYSGQEDAGEDADEESNEDAGEEASKEEEEELLCVYVVGAVGAPGVYYLPAHSRIVDAINEAQGLTSEASLTAVNLAEFISDCQKIYIPTVDEVASGSYSLSVVGESAGSLININTASASELDTLPGIGPALAERIVAYRSSQKFLSCEDLKNVSGIGDVKYAKLAALICV